MSLKQKTISGLTWSFIDSFANQGVSFIVGIILARLLTPQEFGLIGMLTIFIAISQSFINSGFSQALIRKQDCTQQDYSTVFFFNIAVGVFFYLLLFAAAGAIGHFFNEPMLKQLIRVLGLSLIINAFALIQTTLLTKRIDFRLQTKISLVAAVLSGLIGIVMAYTGYGVWSLVARITLGFFFSSLLLWYWNKWRPSLVFSMVSFRTLFAFGGNLLISGLLDTLYRNIYYVIIGKYFSAAELGHYTRAEQFKSLPSSYLQSVIGRVSYPVLSSIQDDPPRLKEAYKRIIRSSMLITFVLMLGLAAVAKPTVFALIGPKWEPCVIYLQLLCFVGMTYPLHAINLNMLYVQGRSDLAVIIEVIKKVLAVPVIIVAIFFGIKAMLLGMILLSFIAYYLNSYWSGRLINYSWIEQIKDVTPSFIIAAVMSAIVFIEGMFFRLPPLPMLLIQVVTGALITFSICEGLRYKDYLYLKDIIKQNFQNKGKSHEFDQETPKQKFLF
jgi:O-antigen/teichoic acid export membrane protein